MGIESPIRMITLSREYGSGGRELGARLARVLRWSMVDRLLVEEVARRVGLERSEVEAVDEHVGGLLERLTSAFTRGTPDLGIVPAYPDPDFIAAVERVVMAEVADGPPIIVVGHGGQCIFRRRPGVLHLRVVAPEGARAGRVSTRREISMDEARKEIQHVDADRERYIRHHFHRSWTDPELYDIWINTASLSMEEAAAVVKGLVAGRAR